MCKAKNQLLEKPFIYEAQIRWSQNLLTNEARQHNQLFCTLTL
jgi:hypothetical protein